MPNVDEKNYNIGRGKVLFKPAGETNFRDLGNAPDFKFAVKTTVLKHPSSREGMKTFDDQVTTEQTAAGSLTLDDLKDFNMKNFIMAAAVNAANQADGSVTDQAVTAELDRWIDLGKFKLSSVVVKNQAGDITYVLNTDYRLDAEAGLLMPLSSGAITAAQALKVSFAHAAVASSSMDAATSAKIEGDLYFVGNPPKGKIVDVLGYVAMTPNGDLSLIGDDWTKFAFDVEFLSGHGYTGLFKLRNRGIVS